MTDHAAESVSSKQSVAELSRSVDDFAIALWRHVGLIPGNQAISPTSIAAALAMLRPGARTHTATELAAVLHLRSTNETSRTWSHLLHSLTTPTRLAKLSIANRLFTDLSLAIDPAFLATLHNDFAAPLEALDFKHHPEPSRLLINAWVEEHTGQRIRDLLPPRAIDAQSRLVLVNAIHFLAQWAEPFAPHATRPWPFHSGSSQAHDVPTMHRLDTFRVAQVGGVKLLELPYAEDEAAMLVVLPDAVDGLAEVERGLSGERLRGWIDALGWRETLVALPRFTVDPVESMRLGDALVALGMPTAFDRSAADFTGIADPPLREDRLVIGEVLHKAFVKVDEEGTEAAAATAVEMLRAGSAMRDPTPPFDFRADHPFLFFIIDRGTGLVLFMGRVAEPGQASEAS